MHTSFPSARILFIYISKNHWHNDSTMSLSKAREDPRASRVAVSETLHIR
jgi:hypothetical protein